MHPFTKFSVRNVHMAKKYFLPYVKCELNLKTEVSINIIISVPYPGTYHKERNYTVCKINDRQNDKSISFWVTTISGGQPPR